MRYGLLVSSMAAALAVAEPSLATEVTTQDLARLSAHVYTYSQPGCEPEASERTCPPPPYGFRAVKPGREAAAFQHAASGTLVVAYTGTRLKEKLDIQEDVGIALAMLDYFGQLLGFKGNVPEMVEFEQPARVAIDERVALSLAFLDEIETLEGRRAVLTGHSLGGFLAQVVAAKRGNRAETFNAPGALGYLSGAALPPERPDILNHVRLWDIVGTKGCHIGTARAYDSDRGPAGVTHDLIYNHGIDAFAAGLEGRRFIYNQAVDWSKPEADTPPLAAPLKTYCTVYCRLIDGPDKRVRAPCPDEVQTPATPPT